MAFDNALLQVVSDSLYVGPVQESKLPFFANSKWSDAAGSADSVSIVTVGDITIGTYTPGSDISFDAGSAGKVSLKCDQLKYLATVVDDSITLVGDYLNAFVDKGLRKIALEADKFVLGKATKANFTANWIAGAADAAIDVNSANILAQLDLMNEKLNASNVPSDNRFVALPPELYTKLVIAVRKSGISMQPTADALFLGKAEKVSGFNVIVSNSYTAAAGVYTVLFGHPDAIAVGVKTPKVESGRLEKQFGDSVKALFAYGATIVDATLAGAAKLKPVAEA